MAGVTPVTVRSGKLCTCQGDDLPHLPRLCAMLKRRTSPAREHRRTDIFTMQTGAPLAGELSADALPPPPGTGLPPGWASRQASQSNPHLIIEK
jgi:hypothetical protein